MLATLVLVSGLTLAPGQTGTLQLTNPRPVLGVLGAVRKDVRILPGDVYCLAFDIENLKSDAEGKVVYSMGLELLNARGETVSKAEPVARAPIYNVLGGNRVSTSAHAEITPDMKPGLYTLKVSVVDKSVKPPKTATLAQKFTVLPEGFGLVKLSTSYDKERILPAPFGGVTGQSLYVNFGLVGAARKKGQPRVSFEMRVLDDEGKPTLVKPMTSEIVELPAGWQAIPMTVLLPLNRPGRYTVELKARDALSMKATQTSFPITVVELK